METINGLFKAEAIRTTVFHPGPFNTSAYVEYATAGWVDWYNNRRLTHVTWASIGVQLQVFPPRSGVRRAW